MADLLQQNGLAVNIAAVNRVDWLRNAAGVIDVNYWKGTLNPRPTVDWYLKLVNAAVDELKQETDGAPVTLLAHSAGGWLARVYLLGFGTAGIDRLVTVGSPHNPPPKDAKIMDQTRGILNHIQETCPGRFHAEVEYVTVAGKYVKGASFTDASATLPQKLAGAGYQQIVGRADVWGDGIVPVEAAHLEGADQVTLDDVFHSPIGSAVSTDSKPGRLWYGSSEVLPKWIQHVVCDESELRQYKVEVEQMLPSK